MPNPSADQRLARRYRRLLAAFPRWHRRLHGPDMVRTLLDAAADGRGTSRHEATVLVLDGLRCRLRVRGAAAIVLAALASAIVASAVGAAAGWIGWQAGIAPYPTVRQATDLAGPVLPPGRPVSTTRVGRDFAPGGTDLADRVLIPVIGDPELTTGGVDLEFTPPHRDSGPVLRAARRHLTAGGWHLAPHLDTYLSGWRLTADRGGYRVQLAYAGNISRTSSDDIVVHVAPAPPAAAYRLTVAGGALGLLVGWLCAAAAVAQARRRTLATRIPATVLAVAGVVASLPACVLTVWGMASGPADGFPPWGAYDLVLARPGAAIGAVLLLIAAALATRVRDGAPRVPVTG